MSVTVSIDEHYFVMNVRMFLCIAFLIVVPFGHQVMAEEPAILSGATDAWRKGDSETALNLIEPILTVVDGSSRELHDFYQNIEVFHNRGEALVQRYQKRLNQDRSPTAYYLLARITLDFGEKERLLQDGLEATPNDRLLVREWARCVYRQGKWVKAE